MSILRPIDFEVAVQHQLAGLLSGIGKPQLVDDVIQPPLQAAEQVYAGDAGGVEGFGHVFPKLGIP